MSTTKATDCPAWCEGSHGPRFAHAGRPTHTFDVITQLRMHHGTPTASIVLDAPRSTGVTLELYELDAVIATLTTCRNRLASAVQMQS